MLAFGAAYATVVRPAYLRGMQVRNLTIMRDYAAILDHFHEAHGQFPRSVREAASDWRPNWDTTGFYLGCLDNWGNSVIYIPTDGGYLLLSFGHDGRPDGSDYVAMRARAELDDSACRDVDVDQVLSDRGEHRACGK